MRKLKSILTSKSTLVIGIVLGLLVGYYVYYVKPLEMGYRWIILISCAGVSTLILDFYINHRYPSASDWRVRGNYKMLLWLTASIILLILVYIGLFLPIPSDVRRTWIEVY